MVRTSARHGYCGASVDAVLAEAGVSRATFYRHFANRKECFLAAYRSRAEPLAEYLRDWDPAPGGEALRGLLTALLGAAEADPLGARLIAIECRALASTRAERAALRETAAATLSRCLAADADAGGEPLQAPLGALLGGVDAVLSRRLHQNRSPRLCALLFDLLTWLERYRVSAREPLAEADWRRLAAGLEAPSFSVPEGPARLPRGRQALSRSESAGVHRARVLLAVARLSRRQGYERITVTDVVADAGVSRAAFYACFRDRHDAFTAAQVAGLQRSVSLTAAAFFGADDWPERLWRGLEAMLGYVASEPDLAAVDIVESYAAGPRAVARSFQNRSAFLLFLEDGYRQPGQARRLPKLCSEAIGGAVLELLRDRVLAGRTETAWELLPAAAYLALAPFQGPDQALAFVDARLGAGVG